MTVPGYAVRGKRMVRKVVRHGNGVALIIDKPMMEILNITGDTTFELSTDGINIILSPKTEPSPEIDITLSLDKVNARHGAVLERLAE